MGKKGAASGKNIPKLDPQKMIQENARLNRVNTSGPFGSQTYTTGPDGQVSYQTQLSPQMQTVIDRAFTMAGQPSARYQPKADFGALIEKYRSRVAAQERK